MTGSDQVSTCANAVITVRKDEPAASDEPAEGPALTKIHLDQSFSGDISGGGAAEFLQAAHADGSASFGIERVTGIVGFTLRSAVGPHRGQMPPTAGAGVRGWQCRVWHGALLGPGCW